MCEDLHSPDNEKVTLLLVLLVYMDIYKVASVRTVI